MLHEERSRAESFGAAAERYDRTRPTYPPALIDAVVGPPDAATEGAASHGAASSSTASGSAASSSAASEDAATESAAGGGTANRGTASDEPASGEPASSGTASGRGPVLDVLDVGCGTGIASRLMTARGARVLGVEIDERMAELARAGGTEVEVGSFEEWDARGRSFDRITAGQAWHWVDPVAGPEKAASLLRPGGKLMPFWNVAEAPAEVRAALDPIYKRIAPTAHSVSVQTGHATRTRYGSELDGIRACASLTEPVVQTFPWNQTYTRDEWLDLMPTHSDHAALPADVLSRLLDEVGAALDGLGGSFEMAYRTLLISATRV